MPDYLRFATTNCLLTGVKGLRLSHLKYGFPPFATFAGTYTVGTGWSQTSYTSGQYAKRIDAGVVTGVYEAKGTFTASADPSTDTTNWRPHGITAAGTGNDFWYGCEPITKWTIKAWWHAGTGWKLPNGLGFPRNYLGSICRYGAAKRRMTAHNGLSVAVTDNTRWEDYTGALDGDFDYAFGRYAVLKFAVGDIVARIIGTGNPAFYRCKVAADYTADSDGTGDPSTDTTHWEAYPGNRSLFLDLTPPALAFTDPFVHYTTTTRYKTWRETTSVMFNGEVIEERIREFAMDAFGRITTSRDDTGSSMSISFELPDPTPYANGDRLNLAGLTLPSDDPVQYTSAAADLFTTFTERHRYKHGGTITIPLSVYPTVLSGNITVPHRDVDVGYEEWVRCIQGAEALFLEYRTDPNGASGGWDHGWDYSIAGFEYPNGTSRGRSTHYTYTQPSSWPGFTGSLDYSGNTTTAMVLSDVSATNESVTFEFTPQATIPWYLEVEVEFNGDILDVEHRFVDRGYLYQEYGDPYHQYAGWIIKSKILSKTSVNASSNLKVVQKIEVLDEYTDATAVADVLAVMSSISLPSGYTADAIVFDAHGAVVRSASVNFAFDQDFAYYRNTQGGQFQYMTTWTDPRPVENLMLIEKAVFWSEPAHWTVVQDVGGSPVETAFPYACSATSHTFAPSDATLASFQVALSDPTP